MLIWAMLNCRYKLDHIGVDGTSWKEQKRRGVLKHIPVDWIGIQATGLKVQNQAETLESPDLKNPGD
jgi:hypothetical protein